MFNVIVSMSLLIGLLGLAWLAMGALIAKEMLARKRSRCDGVEKPEDRGLVTERLKIPVDQGHRLSAWVLRPPDSCPRPSPCVVMVHGFSSHKDCLWTFEDEPGYQGSMLDQGAHSLCEAGFCVVAIDLRNHGDSDVHGHVTLGQDESVDVICTLLFLAKHAEQFEIDAKRIGLRGESMGAATCLIAGSSIEPPAMLESEFITGDQSRRAKELIGAIWCDSPFADARRVVGDFLVYSKLPRWLAPAVRFWLSRMTARDFRWSSPVEYVGAIEQPVFLAHSQDDNMIPPDHLDELLAQDWSRRPEVWRMTRHRHNRLWKEPGYHERQIQFFKSHLRVSEHSQRGSRQTA